MLGSLIDHFLSHSFVIPPGGSLLVVDNVPLIFNTLLVFLGDSNLPTHSTSFLIRLLTRVLFTFFKWIFVIVKLSVVSIIFIFLTVGIFLSLLFQSLASSAKSDLILFWV